LLIPALQLAAVATALWQARHWRRDPANRPDGRRAQALWSLLPLLPTLLAALTLRPLLGKRRTYLRLYMRDYTWIALLCGSIALVWNFVAARLLLRRFANR
jgi:hypothetical protein